MDDFNRKIRELWNNTKPVFTSEDSNVIRAGFHFRLGKRRVFPKLAFGTALIAIILFAILFSNDFFRLRRNIDVPVPIAIDVSEEEFLEEIEDVTGEELLKGLAENNPDEFEDIVLAQLDEDEILELLSPEEQEEILRAYGDLN
jgi:hypothetical protein